VTNCENTNLQRINFTCINRFNLRQKLFQETKNKCDLCFPNVIILDFKAKLKTLLNFCSKWFITLLGEVYLTLILLEIYHVKWVLVTTAWRVLGSQMEGSPLGTRGSCEYIEKAVADSKQGVAFELGGWTRVY